jgi:hypothetical protein
MRLNANSILSFGFPMFGPHVSSKYRTDFNAGFGQCLINVGALSDARFREQAEWCAASSAGRLLSDALTGKAGFPGFR